MNEGNCINGFEKTRNFSKLSLLNHLLKMLKFGANTTSLGREFHKGVTRCEKKNLRAIVLARGTITLNG